MAHDAARLWISSGHDARPCVRRQLISAKQADEIRARTADGETLKALALEYGVTTSTIRRYSA
ncbi:helix-turn-helix domain-containing protein [Streptomyces griseus]|uniref:helix-turn-helix domain-containing protein n=1 Tax=Streptomyces griseus TaxID=1911 RepID=UPI0037A45D6D